MITKTVICPKCNAQITCHGNPEDKIQVSCPNCNEKGIAVFPAEKMFSKTTGDSYVIEVKNLTKTYDGIRAVDHVSFNVSQGEIFGFLGPNGAGKTTTIKAILGLIFPSSGETRINGFNVMEHGKKARKRVGYLPENIAFYDNLTALQTLYFYSEIKHASKDECRNLLRYIGLEDAINRKVGGFSKGMVQRLGIAQALLGNPTLLILDEPTKGLDPQGAWQIREKIGELKEKGVTVFLSSHILSEVQEVCDRVGILDKGALIAEDTVAGLSKKLMMKPQIRIELVEASADVLDAVKEIDGVDDAKFIESSILEVTCDSRVRAEIIRTIEKVGGTVINFQTKEPSLEEIFMKYVRA